MDSSAIHIGAHRALMERDPATKVAAVSELEAARWTIADDWQPDSVEVPGRPDNPELIHPARVRKRSLGTDAGRVALLHAVAHIEFNAINLALDAIYRFPGCPGQYYTDWLSVAADEARHFTMLAERLTELGSFYGQLPAHNGLWEMAIKTESDHLQRMALVPRVLEARGLDVSPAMIERLDSAGDSRSADLIRIILAEEVGHVAIGDRWFRYLCAEQELEPESTFASILAEHGVSIRPPINKEARMVAGFSERELTNLINSDNVHGMGEKS